MGLEEDIKRAVKQQDVNKRKKTKPSQEVIDLGKGRISRYDRKERSVTGRPVTEGCDDVLKK